jgi:hypothetical protein
MSSTILKKPYLITIIYSSGWNSKKMLNTKQIENFSCDELYYTENGVICRFLLMHRKSGSRFYNKRQLDIQPQLQIYFILLSIKIYVCHLNLNIAEQ